MGTTLPKEQSATEAGRVRKSLNGGGSSSQKKRWGNIFLDYYSPQLGQAPSSSYLRHSMGHLLES